MKKLLVEVFDCLSDKTKQGVSQLCIEKLIPQMNKNTNMLEALSICLSSEVLPDKNNTLVATCKEIKEYFEIDSVELTFGGVTEENVNALLDSVISIIINMFYSADFMQYSAASSCRFHVDNRKLIVSTTKEKQSAYANVLGDVCKQAATIIEKLTGYETTSSEIVISDELEDISDAFSSAFVEEDIVAETIKPQNINVEEKVVVKDKKSDKPVDKDSWEYQAAERKRQQRENGNSESYKNHPKNIKEAIVGKVRSGVSTYKITDIEPGLGLINVIGRLKLTGDIRLSKNGNTVIAPMELLDDTGAISAIMFLQPKEADVFEKNFGKGGYASFQGVANFDRGELNFRVEGILPADKPKPRKDISELKRVELHAHTKMSEKDAVTEPDELMKRAAYYGHPACAVTDHGVVHAFPKVCETAKKLKVGDTDKPFKAILGMEGYLVDDGPTCVFGLPIDPETSKAIGSIVALSVKASGDDSCVDKIESIYAVKYRLVGYKAKAIEVEGESNEDAKAFSTNDIDTSLWESSELPKGLVDEEESSASLAMEDSNTYVCNKSSEEIGEIYANSGEPEFIPEQLHFEHVADFFCEVDDEIYSGSGEPGDSYFKVAKLSEFIGDSYICGDNIFRDLGFIRRAGFGLNIEDHKYYRIKFLQPVICCNEILRLFYSELNASSVKDAVIKLNCELDLINDDSYKSRAIASASLLTHCLIENNTVDPYRINELCGHISLEQIKARKTKTYHIIFLCRNNLALYNMYHLVSESHINYFSFRPRTPRSLLKYYGSSIIVGAACERGEIYRTLFDTYQKQDRNPDKTLEDLFASEDFARKVAMYDYIEIQPLCNNSFMTREVSKDINGIEHPPLTMDDIQTLNVLLVEIADHYALPCCATTDAHFLDEKDGMYRKYMLMDMGFGDAENQAALYFRTTDEMLKEFSYLGEEKAIEVVVTNTNNVADKIELGLKAFPDGTYPPIINTAAADVRDITYTKANRLYRYNGKLNDVVYARLEKELKSIIGNGFAIMYYIAYRLVKKSNNDGYIVGSRGSVGSSLVATMCGISEVNPLPPHHRCPHCNYAEFDTTGEYGSGYDLPEKNCPHCNTPMIKDGQDIPFETFLGFFGDKQPDIDLNFSSEYQPRAHKYVEYLFGKTHTFRAGTIGTYADKNAYGIARKVGELQNKTYSNAMLDYMSEGIIGVKRTTSQHPGGIVVVPKEMDVYEFTPVQCPANKTSCGIITTHFDFRAMHDTILKLDILGHADPTVLKMLNKLTNVDVTTIPIPDKEVMKLLESTEPLGFDESKTDAGSATLGLSELGTHMARGMIKETHPSHFFDLVQLMGLSHGTDVWNGNAQDLIRDKICDLNSVIGCRDSIMTRLIYWGLPNKDSFDIMEKVRKGKGLTPEQEQLMRDNNVPDWYITSCKKIKYMFPKAHAAAYSISTLRVAWFKVYYPEEYYCAFFSIRGDEFDALKMCSGVEKVANRRKELAILMRQDNNPKTKSEFYLCELVEEMYARGIEFVPISLEHSQAVNFTKVGDKKILPPLDAIESISGAMAEGIVAARQEKPFVNREDLMKRSGIGKSALATLVEFGLCDDLPESSQINIFDLMV